jgi:hypothetical protein
MVRLRAGSRWIVRKLALRCGMTERETEQAVLALIARGHLRVVAGDGPQGSDAFEFIFEEPIQ